MWMWAAHDAAIEQIGSEAQIVGKFGFTGHLLTCIDAGDALTDRGGNLLAFYARIHVTLLQPQSARRG